MSARVTPQRPFCFGTRSALLISGFVAAVGLAEAQSSVAQGEEVALEAATAASEEDAAALRYDTITVTSQKREQSIADVPIAITAFLGDDLEKAGVTSTRDLQLVTPGLAFTQAAYVPQPSIRGIGGRGTGPGHEQTVPIYIDGAYQSFVLGGIFELNSIDRIEVLKGPQGALLGRNAAGGAINIITKDPVEGFEGSVTAGYGRFNEVRAEGYISGGTDKLGANLSVQYLGDDGYVEEKVSGEDIAEVDSLDYRGKIVWRPTDRTTLKLGGNWSKREDNTSLAIYGLDGNSTFAVSFGANTGSAGSYEVFLSEVPELTVEQKSATLTVEHQFDIGTLTSITGYSKGRTDYIADQDVTDFAFANVALQLDQRDESITQDIYLASDDDGRFSWVAGVFFIDNEASQDPVIIGPGISFYRIATTTEGYAVYFQGDYEFDTGTTLSLGARYNYDEKCAESEEFIAGSNGILESLPKTCDDWERINPSATLSQKIGNATNVYLRYATAYKAGVFNAGAYVPDAVDPEDVEQFEIGVKTQLTPRIRFDGAIYYTNYEDLQVTSRDPVNLSVLTLNAADAEMTGIEGDLVFAASDQLNLRAGFSQIDHEYKSFPGAQGYTRNAGGGNTAFFFDASGKPLVKVPNTMVTLAGDYTLPAFGGGLTMAANLSYTSEYNWDIDGRVEQPATTIVNGSLTWRSADDRFELQAWGRNLTDEDVPLSVTISTLGDSGRDIKPLSYGVTGTIHF